MKMDRSEWRRGWRKPKITHGKLTRWNWVCYYPEKLKMGKYVDIGMFTFINAKFGVAIEDNVEIGSHCAIVTYSTIDGKSGPIVLRKNCRIGAHSVIMPNVIIGENTVIGAGSFVDRSVGPNKVVIPYRDKVTKAKRK